MSLEFPLQEITENGGPVVMAHLAVCSCGDSDMFHIFQVAGQTHFHIECVQCETSYCPFGACQLPDKPRVINPVHEEGGQWYFWDETGVYRYGPYPNELTAHDERKKYCEQQL